MTGMRVLFFEAFQVVPHDVAGSDAAAGTVDADHHGAGARIGGRGIQPFAEQRHRIFAGRGGAGHIHVQQDAIDIDHRDGRAAGCIVPRNRERPYRPGIPGRRRLPSACDRRRVTLVLTVGV